jgi:hypothetical protein
VPVLDPDAYMPALYRYQKLHLEFLRNQAHIPPTERFWVVSRKPSAGGLWSVGRMSRQLIEVSRNSNRSAEAKREIDRRPGDMRGSDDDDRRK